MTAASVNNSARGFSAVGGTTISSASFAVGGSNRVLYAFVFAGASSPTAPSTVKWNTSESFSQLSTTLNASAFGRHTLWRLIGPTATTATADATWGASMDERLIIVVAVQDADQTTPNNAIATATGTDNTPSVTVVSISGDLVLDGMGFLDTGQSSRVITPDASQVSIQEIEGADTVGDGIGSSRETAAGSSTVMSWTISGAHDGWATFGFDVNPVGGPPPADTSWGKIIVNRLRPRPFGPGTPR
jgi:hypothetical protein